MHLVTKEWPRSLNICKESPTLILKRPLKGRSSIVAQLNESDITAISRNNEMLVGIG